MSLSHLQQGNKDILRGFYGDSIHSAMSRPPSARPKTSAGRASSAARQRTPSAQGEPVARPERPQTRSSMVREEPPPPRNIRLCLPFRGSESRSGGVLPMRAESRVGVTAVARPLTAARPLTGQTPLRPMTQQGVAGLRAVSRVGSELPTGERRGRPETGH